MRKSRMSRSRCSDSDAISPARGRRRYEAESAGPGIHSGAGGGGGVQRDRATPRYLAGVQVAVTQRQAADDHIGVADRLSDSVPLRSDDAPG